jgi:site-specific DNA recombinase
VVLGPVTDPGSCNAESVADTSTSANCATSSASLTIRRFVPHRVQRRGTETRLVIGGPGAPARDDAALLKVVARAYCWFDDLIEGRVASIHELAEELDMTTRYVQRLLALALLTPVLVEQIAAGQHPPTLTVDRLTDHGPLAIRWAEQIKRLSS